jgi:hypothetical protein
MLGLLPNSSRRFTALHWWAWRLPLCSGAELGKRPCIIRQIDFEMWKKPASDWPVFLFGLKQTRAQSPGDSTAQIIPLDD